MKEANHVEVEPRFMGVKLNSSRAAIVRIFAFFYFAVLGCVSSAARSSSELQSLF